MRQNHLEGRKITPALDASPFRKMAWLRPLGSRIKTNLWIKAIGTPAFMAGFFALYFLLLKFPVFPVTVMPLTMIDRLIGFQPGAWWLYVSLWLYTSLPPALLDDKRELISYGFTAAGLAFAGLAIFFFYPTAVPQSGIDWTLYPTVASLKQADTAGNACPSLHVAFAVFSAIVLDRLLRRMKAGFSLRIFNGCWCVGILYSTLAIRQHVALDVLAGAVLGAVAAIWRSPVSLQAGNINCASRAAATPRIPAVHPPAELGLPAGQSVSSETLR
jgi:membrane-associated phospholipid phosphatase